jgi:SM-20-related protein
MFATDALVNDLHTQGWSVQPALLDGSVARALAAECLLNSDQGHFRPAHVGRGPDKQIREDIRNDHVLWLAADDDSPAISAWLAALEQLRQQLNQQLFLGLFEYEGHFSIYPPGGFYKPHLDRHRHTQDRLVTVILYLNDPWEPAHGGHLRLWTTPGAAEGPDVLIEPRLGTLVCFFAGDHWHEVLPSHQSRLSITGWFRRRPE